MNLAATILLYWLFAYKNSILNAYQRVDVVNKVMLCTDEYALSKAREENLIFNNIK